MDVVADNQAAGVTVAELPPQCSAEVAVSTKGIVTWTVKSYRHSVEDAIREALSGHNELLQKFGKPA